MAPRLPLLLSSLLTLTAACGEGAEPARFADATPAQLENAYRIARGADGALAVGFATAFSGASAPEACPSIVTEGTTTTVTGGCVAANGTSTEGSLVIENLPGPRVVRFDDLVVIDADGDELAFDGHVSAGPLNPVYDIDLTVTSDGSLRHTRFTLWCDDDGVCEPAAGAEIELDDLGAATFEGVWDENRPIGALFLHGEDTVIFDISASEGTGCIEYHLDDGSVGSFCDDAAVEGE